MPGLSRYGILAPVAALALIAAAAPSAGAGPVQDPIPIGPGVYFTAQVNAHGGPAVITVVCPGPITATSTGHPLAGQKVEVLSGAPTSAIDGYTGTAAHSIDAIVSGPSGSTVNLPIVLTSFFAPVAIPTTLVLPCSGTGVVSFVPIPASPTARGFAVKVTFVDIAA